MDTQLVEKIVHEVKSQGVFDEFRKDSMADVDTKPAYQNLRQRVENTVKKFLSEQKWTPETNKNQLREKLRRHITESGFLDVGVERIVDQVVNPKIGSVFQPRIEEIAYKYLGLPPPPKKFDPPPPPLMHPLPPLPLNAPPLKVETSSLLPTDLEQVSPDSDKGTVKSEDKDDRTTVDMDTEEKLMEDEDESPPFEPLVKQEIEDTKRGVKEEYRENKANIKQECDTSSDDKINKFEEINEAVIKTENVVTDNDSQETSNFALESAEMDKDASQSIDARISQDSQLSSVSSDSRLSINGKEDSLQSSSQEAVAANISEEAQMPKFNENSCEPGATNGNANEKLVPKSELHFDIKKDEIKFEGTERKSGLETPEPTVSKSEEEAYLPAEEATSLRTKTDDFKFNTNKLNLESKEEDCERTPNAQELSFGSSIEDSSSMPPNQTPKSATQNKEKYESLQMQTPKQAIRPNTPTTTPIPTPPLPTPTATPSPVTQSQKTDKEHQSRHSSSSSSKHKKHSKERRRSYEREKDKDSSRDRHRSSKDSRDTNKYHSSSGTKSSNKHSSSSSSKYSSSHNKSNEKDIEKSSSSSTHSSSKHIKHSHSHSSSSSNENQDSKKSKRDSDSRRHHTSSSSSSKRSERKDDHGEAKHKTQRRKSTDSNDDEGDKYMSGGKSSSQYKSSSYSSSSASKSSKTKYNTSETNKGNDVPKDQMEAQEINEHSTGKTQYQNNVVILNDILENPQTQFIQLNQTGHLVETPLQHLPPTSAEESHKLNQTGHLVEAPVELLPPDSHKLATAEFNNNIEPFPSKEEQKPAEQETCSLDLLYFEEIQLNLSERLRQLNATMDLCRSAVNSLRFDSLSDEGIELSNEEDINSDNNKTNLLTETLKRKSDFNYKEFETTPRKRVVSHESEGCQSKTSPTPSDTSSVNSKENEEIHKNTDHAKKSLVDRHKAVQKLTQQQRYSSEDLYKPRPILGQRSRRRGMDSLL